MRSPDRFRLFSLAGPAAGLLAFLLLSGAALAANRTVEVGQGGQTRFVDDVSHTSTTTISAGDSVNWVWDSGPHSTTSGSCPNSNCVPDGHWNSGEHSGPFSFSSPAGVFNTPGSYPYFCSYHGAMMQGMVIVQAVAPVPTASFTFSPAAPLMGTAVAFTDASTGTPTSWSWNFGDPASGGSNTSTVQNPTHTFQSAGSYTVSLQASNASGSNTATKTVAVTTGGGVACDPSSPENLCLNNGRFELTAEWQKSDGSSGHGTAVKLTNDSGYFWFFDPANIEVVMKVLNGCGLTNSYWVFAAGLTNVKVDLRVLDTQTGFVYTKENPLGTAYAPIQDTGAFPSSCP